MTVPFSTQGGGFVTGFRMPVSLAIVAQAAGVSRMTASRALRGCSEVSPHTRKAVEKAAAKVGWKPNPEVGQLMGRLRSLSTKEATQTLAVVWPDATKRLVAERATLRLLRDGMRERARFLGFGLDEFFLETDGLSARRLSRVLYARGIVGVIVAPVSFHAHMELDFDWDRFAAVAVGAGLNQPGLSRVHNDHYKTISECISRARQAGHQRIGLLLNTETADRLNGQLQGAFVARHPLGAVEALRLLCFQSGKATHEAIAKWLKKAQPDVVIGEQANGEFLRHAAQAATGSRRPPAFVTFNRMQSDPDTAGMNQRFDRIGAAAVDAVAAQYGRNEKGISNMPKTILTEGEWMVGSSRRRARMPRR